MPAVVSSTDSGPRASGVTLFTTKSALAGGGVVVTHALGYVPKIIMLTSDLGNGVSFTSVTTQTVTISNGSTGDTVTALIW